MNDPRGSLWRKWDLHVHTPASVVHQYGGTDPRAQFLDELEALPEEFKVIGINDHIFLDGYRRVMQEKRDGRLKKIDLFLPVIELRLDKFGGTNHHHNKVNYHVIFSNELDPDVIEHQFLNALATSYQLSPQHDDLKGKWHALPTKASLEELGRMIIETVPAEERGKYGAPLVEGFNNLCMSLDAINEALKKHYSPADTLPQWAKPNGLTSNGTITPSQTRRTSSTAPTSSSPPRIPSRSGRTARKHSGRVA